MRKKKILFIIWSYTMGGGAESLLTSIVNRLNPEKYEIDIIEYHHAGIKTEPVNKNIHVLPFIQSKQKWVMHMQSLILYTYPQLIAARHIRKQYDLYIAFNYLVPSFLLPKKTKNIQWIHSDVYDLSVKKEIWKKKKQDRALDKANKIVVISDYTEKSVRDLFPRHSDKLIKLYNGIDIDAVNKKSHEDTDIRLQTPSIVFVGRLEDRKNPLRLIDVMKIVHEKYTGEAYPHLYLLGAGEQEQLIIDKVKRYNLSQFVHILGYQKNPFPIIRQCDVVCLLSKSEGFSMCLLESVALNKPFVSTQIGGARELLHNCNCGYSIETDEEAADAIMELLRTDKNKVAKECQNSIRQFEISAYIREIEKLIDNVINEDKEKH